MPGLVLAYLAIKTVKWSSISSSTSSVHSTKFSENRICIHLHFRTLDWPDFFVSCELDGLWMLDEEPGP